MRRRGFLKGLPAAAAAAIPLGAAAPVFAETTNDKVVRLSRELSHALGDFCDGQFKAVVGPDDGIVLKPSRELSAQERFDYHLAEFKRAAEDLDPMIRDWIETGLNPEMPCCLIVSAYRRTGQYEGDGIYQSGRQNVWGQYGEWRVTLRPNQMIDGERTFQVQCPGERMVMTEPHLETFIGRRLGGFA